MAIKTRPDIKAAVDVAFADNTTGAITAESLRIQLEDLADSALFSDEALPAISQSAIQAGTSTTVGASTAEALNRAFYAILRTEGLIAPLPAVISVIAPPSISSITTAQTLGARTTQGTYSVDVGGFSVVTTWKDSNNAALTSAQALTEGLILRPIDTVTASTGGTVLVVEGSPVTVQAIGYSVASAPAGYTITNLGGDNYQLNAGSGPYAAASPYPFTGTALDAAGLIVLASLTPTGGNTVGSTKTAIDPLVIGLAGEGGIKITREWRTGGVGNGTTTLTRVVSSGDVSAGSDIKFTVQNDRKLETVVKAAVAALAFVPTDLAELESWIDASDASMFTLTGTRIDAVADKSAKARNWNAGTDATKRPVKGANSVTFSGLTGVGLTRSSFYQATDTYSIFAVVKFAATGSSRVITTATNTALTIASDLYRQATNLRFAIKNEEGANIVVNFTASDSAVSGADLTLWHTVEILHSPGLHQIYIDGTLEYSKAYTQSGTYNGLYVGLFGQPNSVNGSISNANGVMGQYAHISTQDSVKRSQMRNYMNTKRDALIAGAE